MARGRPKGTKNKPREAHKIARERRFKSKSQVRSITKITAAQFEDMHRFCVNKQDIMRMMRISEAEAIKRGEEPHYPTNLKAVCDYPNHGYCFHGQPSPEILQRINDKLGFKYDAPPEDESSPEEVQDEDNGGTEEVERVEMGSVKSYKIKLGGK